MCVTRPRQRELSTYKAIILKRVQLWLCSSRQICLFIFMCGPGLVILHAILQGDIINLDLIYVNRSGVAKQAMSWHNTANVATLDMFVLAPNAIYRDQRHSVTSFFEVQLILVIARSVISSNRYNPTTKKWNIEMSDFELVKWRKKEVGSETEMSFWENCRTWLHRKLSFWQLPVQQGTIISSKLHFLFSGAMITVSFWNLRNEKIDIIGEQ